MEKLTNQQYFNILEKGHAII